MAEVASDAPRLQARGLGRHFQGPGRTQVEALAGVELDLCPGEAIWLHGPSGAGKTTLLACLGGLLRPTAGEVLLDGAPFSKLSLGARARRLGRAVAYVLQDMQLVPYLSARDNVALGLVDLSRAQARPRAARELERLGLGARLLHLPAALSAGERQRVAVARALIGGPRLVLADEPTAALDRKAAAEVWAQLEAFRAAGGALIVATHARGVPLMLTRTLELRAGRPWTSPEAVLDSSANMIVAIDGPAGSGKSTAARALALRLGVPFLDTGAMYRAVTWVALRRGVAPGDGTALADLARELHLDFDGAGHILVDGEPGEPHIRAAEINAHVSEVAAHSGVRRALVPTQQALGRRHGVVAEGRDTTTVVFPDADHKFFLVASPAERARRRAQQEGTPDRAAEIQADIERRDGIDSSRSDSPLTEAEDAVRVVTDDMDAEGVVDALLAIVREREAAR